MTEPSWPWRLFRFKGRATRREYWCVIVPAVMVGLTYVIWDHARREPGEPWDTVGSIGVIVLFAALAVCTCVMGRRFADFGWSPLVVKLLAASLIAAESVIRVMDTSPLIGNVINAGILIAALASVGLPKGTPEDCGYGPDPRLRRNRET